jgi:hypothetical protein
MNLVGFYYKNKLTVKFRKNIFTQLLRRLTCIFLNFHITPHTVTAAASEVSSMITFTVVLSIYHVSRSERKLLFYVLSQNMQCVL